MNAGALKVASSGVVLVYISGQKVSHYLLFDHNHMRPIISVHGAGPSSVVALAPCLVGELGTSIQNQNYIRACRRLCVEFPRCC